MENYRLYKIKSYKGSILKIKLGVVHMPCKVNSKSFKALKYKMRLTNPITQDDTRITHINQDN